MSKLVRSKYVLFITTFLMLIALLGVVFSSTKVYALSTTDYIYTESNAWHLQKDNLNILQLFKDIKSKTTIDVLNSKNDDVVVAVIDSGVDKTNPFFEEGTFWVNDYEAINGIDGKDNDKNGVKDDINGASFDDGRGAFKASGNFDDCMNEGNSGTAWHGTHVAGIIHQIAPNVKIMPIRAGKKEGSKAGFNALQVINAILYAADNGADIINMSLGTFDSGFVTRKQSFKYKGETKTMSIADAINYAVNEHNIMVVAAAGNNNIETDFYPASLPNVVSVMASNNEKTLWQKDKVNGSNYNDNFDIIAPGFNILSTLGKGVTGASIKDNKNKTVVPKVNYGFKSGTSMASPYVAGVAALIMSVTGISGSDLSSYLTDQNSLSATNIVGNCLEGKKLLLDYNAVNKILDNVLENVDIQDSDKMLTFNKEVYDNELLVLTATKNYKGEYKWYNNNVEVSDGLRYSFIPTEDTIVELKIDGYTVEKYIIKAKSYTNYLLTIVGSVVGSVGGIILILVAVYFVIKRKRQHEN